MVGVALHGNRVHGRNAAAQVGKVFGTAVGHAGNGVHHGRTVHDGDRFLGAETVRGDTEFGHHILRRPALTLVKHVTFTDDCAGEVRKRSQVTARTHGAFLRNQGQDIVLQERHHDLEEGVAHAGETLGKRIDAHSDNGAGCLLVKVVAHAASMKTRQVDRQFIVTIRRHNLRARIAIARGYAVNATMFGKGLVQEFRAGIDLFLELGRRIQFHDHLALCNGHDLFNC